MKTEKNDLREQNNLADALIAKLERIKELWAEIPSEDDFDELEKRLGRIEGSMERIAELAASQDFPSEDDFIDLDRKLGGIVGSLDTIIEKQEQIAE